MKPLIGLTPDFHSGDRPDMGGKEPTYFLRARYTQAIEDAGGIPLVLPFVSKVSQQRNILGRIDGVLLTGGGADLPPALYGETPAFSFRHMNAQRSDLELGLASLAYRLGIPLLGICGGMQSINVALGGTLIQDIPSQIGSPLSHQPATSATNPAHTIDIMTRTLLHRIVGKRLIPVNSSHHQSVKRVSDRLMVSAKASDGVIEAIESPSHLFLLGVQWHPEFLYQHDPLQKKLLRSFVAATRFFAARRFPRTSRSTR